MAADGLIVLGLDVSQTQAEIQAGLDSILNKTKTKEIILKTAIEKAETEKKIDSVVKSLNKKTVKMGVEVDARSVNNILAAQQKIASTQAKLNAQMKEYRDTASKIGLTLNKDSWNPFSRAVKDGDFAKANEILKSTKKQIEAYNAAVQKMNSDTSVSGSVSSIVEQFSKLKDVSTETQKRVNLLKANLAQFENADNTQKKLSAYKRLQTMIESLSDELRTLSSTEKSQSSDLSIKKKIDDARSSLEVFKTQYEGIGNSAAAQKVTAAITALDTALKGVDSSASGGALAKQWDKVSAAIDNAKRAVAEYNAASKSKKTTSGILEDIKNAETYVKNLNTAYASIGDSAGAEKLKKAISELQTALKDIDKSATGNKLSAQWDSVATKIAEAKRAVAEYNAEQSAIGSLGERFDDITDKIQTALSNIGDSGIKGTGVDQLTTDLTKLQEKAELVQKDLGDLDPNNAEDVKRLSTAIEELEADFSKLKDNASSFKDPISAQQLATNIEKAKQKVAEYGETYSAIKSRPDLVKELNELQKRAEDLSTKTDLKKFNADFEQFNTKVKQAGLHTKSLGDRLKDAFKNFASFFSASRVIYEVISKLGEMVQNVKNLDAAMVNLRKVTDETDASYDRFLIRATAKAKELGTTIVDLVDATTNFSRLGFSLSEAEELGQLATIYANVGDLSSIDDATNSMISTMKGFGIEAENASAILDKFNEVGNNFAISSGDIGEALQRSASSMAAANNTIDETIALITAANTVVQDATSVGTAFKTISMRIRGATTEMEQAGLDMEGMADSTAKLRKEIMALSGVDIMIDDNTFKSTYQILEELAAKWGELTDIQQASVTELIAGKRQGNIISAVMDNFDIAQDALNSSLESAGSAMQEYNTYLEGIEAKTNQFKAAFEALSLTVINSDFLKGIIEFGTGAITVLDKIIQSFGGVGNALLNIASIIALFNPAKTLSLVKTIFTTIGNFTGITKLTSGIKALTSGWQAAKSAGLSFGQFLGNLKGQLLGTASAATVVTAAITAVVAVITIAVSIYSNWKRKQEEMRQSLIEEGDTAVENSNKIAELTAKYLDMCEAVDNGTASTKDMAQAQDDVIAALELTGRSVRELTEEYGSLKDAIIAASQGQLKTNTSAAIAGANAAKEQVESDLKTGWFGGNSKYFSSIGEEAGEIMSYLESLGYEGIDNTSSQGGGTIFLPSVYLTGGDSAKASFEDLMADYKYLEKMMNDIRSEFGTDNDLFKQVSSLYAEYDQNLSSAIQKIDQANQAIAQELIFAAQTDEIPKTAEEYIQVREQLISDLENNADWDENGTYSAEGLINSLLSENAVFQEIAQLVAEEEILAAEFKAKRDSIAEAIIPKDYENLTEGMAAHFHTIDSYATKLYELKNKLDTLSTEDLDIAYELMAVPDNNIQSWDDLTQAIEDYKNGTSNLIPVSNKVQESIKAIWASEDFADAKAELVAMAKTLDGITPDAIEELAGESEELAKILELDGMNAEFLAHVLQTVADGKDGFALITDDALKLNDALEGMVTAFDDVTEAKARYDAALAGGEKDDNFKNYAEALEALNEEFVKGYENSNQFWAAAEYLFGTEQLNEWGWSQGLDEIYAAMERNVAIFGDAESAGTGFLDRLYEISEAGQITADDGSVIAQIEKLADGTYNFQFDSGDLDALAERLGITSEAATACMQALSMYKDFNFYDIGTVMSTIEEIGLASDSINGTAVNVGTLTDQLIALGYNNKDIFDLMNVLKEVDGVSLIDINANVDTLAQSISDLGLAAQDGVDINVNADGLADLMSQLNFTREDTQKLITKLGEADGITLTNAEGEVVSLNDALEYTDGLTFASVTSEIDGITSSAELAEQAVEDLQYSINTLKGKTVTVTLDVQRKSGILGSIFGYAKGTDGAPEGDALVGEEGEELVQSGNRAYFVGTNGAEIVHLNEGDKVYTAAETRKIKRGATVIRGVVPAFAGGTGLGKPDTPTYTSVLPDKPTTTTNSSTTDKSESEFERLYKYHQHLLNMDQESVADYIAWLDAAYQEAYKNGEIELEDYYKYQEEVFDKVKSMLDDVREEHENAITLTQNWLDNAIADGDRGKITQYTSEIVAHYKAMQEELHKEAEYYRSLGYSDTSDEVSKLSDLWWDYYDKIKTVSADAWQQVIDNANDALDSVTDLYDTLKDAAQEYAENGNISVKTLQSIYKLGVQNLAYLQDENGQLVINEENIQKVIAARTQQMAIETALNYIQQLRTALTNEDTAALNNLIFATDVAANSTWDLVYAQLQLLGLSDEQYNNVLQRINAMRSLTDMAVTSIGRVDTSAKEALEETSTALEDLLKYVEEMIKQEVENQISALEDQIDKYREIVDLQKKSLDLEREKDKYTKDVTEKTKSIAELQVRIAMLDLDDSREAQAEKRKLQEQLAEEQSDLAETQADHAYEATSDMLDNMADAYEDEKNKEIEILQDSISSAEKIYQMAIDRINNHWSTLYDDLLEEQPTPFVQKCA